MSNEMDHVSGQIPASAQSTLISQKKVDHNKLREYENMFKILFRQKDYNKLQALILELKSLNLDASMVEKWQKILDKKQSGGFLTSFFKKKKKKTVSSGVLAPLQKVEAKAHPPMIKKAPENPVPIEARPAVPVPISTQKIPQISPKINESLPKLTPISQPAVHESVSEAKPIFSENSTDHSTASISNASSDLKKPENKLVVSQAPEVTGSISPPLKPKQPDIEAQAKGNTFTKMFGHGSGAAKTGSVIDQIVASSEKKKKTPNASLQTKAERQVKRLYSFSKIFANFTAIFIVLTAAFLFVETDSQNRVLGAVGVDQNTGSKLHASAESLAEKENEVAVLELQINQFSSGYADSSLGTVQTLIEERINWPDIISKINEVTHSVYELNDFFQYIQYDNYSFDAERQTIRITGTLSDPQGRNLTKLVELEEAFMSFPGDLNDPEDTTLPYFQDFKELTSLRKTFDEKTGRYVSDFQLSFVLSSSDLAQ